MSTRTLDWIERLLDHAGLVSRSLRQYRIGLMYWETWHRLRYASPLPLSLGAPQTVEPKIVDEFVADHTPVVRDRRVCMRMVDEVNQGIREAGYNRDIDCVTPNTTYWRIDVLSHAHRLASLPFDRKAILVSKEQLNAVWEAERAALGMPTAVPMSAASIVSALLSGCGVDRNGVRDVALIVLAQRLTVGQICQVGLGELICSEVNISGSIVPAIELAIRDPVGEFQAFDQHLCLLGEDARRVKAWWDIRHVDGAATTSAFFVRVTAKKEPQPLNKEWVCQHFRTLAQHAGMVGPTGRSPCSPNAIRKAFEREWREQSGLVRTAHMAGMTTQSVLGYGQQR